MSQPNTDRNDKTYRDTVVEFLSQQKYLSENIPVIDSMMISEKICKLKLHKAGGHDSIQNENVIHAGSSLAIHLSLLFNALLRHSFVPDDFRTGIIKPLPKVKHGDLSNVDMYRGITLTPVISKLFESVLLSLYGDYLYSDQLQFGFKENSGCNDALFTFTESVKYFNKHNSKVYCAFLDASKAFDKVLINGLILKLIKRNVPVHFVRLLFYWFNNLRCSVVWLSMISSPFDVARGIRQGGVLSPFLFAVYVDDLIERLRASGFVIYIGCLFYGCILYADDIVLLSGSCYGLQKLLDICGKYGIEWDIKFNPGKSVACTFGGKSPSTGNVQLFSQQLQWSTQVKYLGCQFKCYTCEIDTQPFICKFYGAFNNILRVIGSKRNEMVAVHLIKSYCLPSLLYSCETWHARSDDIRSANIAWNNSFRKVFNSFWRESVKPLLMYCWCLPVSVLIHQGRLLFWKKCLSSDKPV